MILLISRKLGEKSRLSSISTDYRMENLPVNGRKGETSAEIHNKVKKQTMNQRNQIHPNVNNTNTSHKWKYPIIIPFSEEFKSRTEFSKTPWCKQRWRMKKRSTGGFFKVNGPVGRISDRNQEGQCSCIQRPSGQLWEGRDEYEPSNEGTEATPSSLHSGSLICQGSRPSPARLAHYTCNAG